MNTVTQKRAGNKMFDAQAFFKNRDGLRISHSFTQRILLKEGLMPCRGLVGVVNNMLNGNKLACQIVDEFLGGMEEVCNHPFTLDQIAEKINLQARGGDGDLLNNGHANIFFLLVSGQPFFISVHWRHSGPVGNVWIVNEWELNDRGYGASSNTRVFRNTTL